MEGMRDKDAIGGKAYCESYPSDELVHLCDSVLVQKDASSSYGRKCSGIALESVEGVYSVLIRHS